MFTLSVFLMAVPTLGIGLLPVYAQVGMLAPLALLSLRVVQGIAVGGEVPGAWVFVAEHVPARRVGFACASLTSGLTVGIVIGWFNLLGTLNISNDWYWRGVVARILGSVFPGGWFSEVSGIGGDNPAQVLSTLSVMHSYSAMGSMNLWIGVAAAAAMLAGAIWFRRWRDDS